MSQILDKITIEIIPLYLILDLCHILSDHKQFVILKKIKFNTSMDCSALITTFIDVKEVTKIRCGDWYTDQQVENLPQSFYYLLYECHNLKKLFLLIKNISLVWSYLLPLTSDEKFE